MPTGKQFESLALEYLRGVVLVGPGLCDLGLEAGRFGHPVIVIDSDLPSVTRVNRMALDEGLPVRAMQDEFAGWPIDKRYDTIVVSGLLPLLSRSSADDLIRRVQQHLVPGGRAILSVPVGGGDAPRSDRWRLLPGELEEMFDG